eukprot:GHVR01065655.1.p1 GENE.GHVR01065655.1~~GHVR01065655.1.p1  ORF type:complete len:675 (-),score=71.44 GHVR01065655.1:515-2539(-)
MVMMIMCISMYEKEDVLLLLNLSKVHLLVCEVLPVFEKAFKVPIQGEVVYNNEMARSSRDVQINVNEPRSRQITKRITTENKNFNIGNNGTHEIHKTIKNNKDVKDKKATKRKTNKRNNDCCVFRKLLLTITSWLREILHDDHVQRKEIKNDLDNKIEKSQEQFVNIDVIKEYAIFDCLKDNVKNKLANEQSRHETDGHEKESYGKIEEAHNSKAYVSLTNTHAHTQNEEEELEGEENEKTKENDLQDSTMHEEGNEIEAYKANWEPSTTLTILSKTYKINERIKDKENKHASEASNYDDNYANMYRDTMLAINFHNQFIVITLAYAYFLYLDYANEIGYKFILNKSMIYITLTCVAFMVATIFSDYRGVYAAITDTFDGKFSSRVYVPLSHKPCFTREGIIKEKKSLRPFKKLIFVLFITIFCYESYGIIGYARNHYRDLFSDETYNGYCYMKLLPKSSKNAFKKELGAYPKVVDFLKHSIEMKVRFKKNYTVSLSNDIFHIKESKGETDADILRELNQCRNCMIGAHFNVTESGLIKNLMNKYVYGQTEIYPAEEEEVSNHETELDNVDVKATEIEKELTWVDIMNVTFKEKMRIYKTKRQKDIIEFEMTNAYNHLLAFIKAAAFTLFVMFMIEGTYNNAFGENRMLSKAMNVYEVYKNVIHFGNNHYLYNR